MSDVHRHEIKSSAFEGSIARESARDAAAASQDYFSKLQSIIN